MRPQVPILEEIDKKEVLLVKLLLLQITLTGFQAKSGTQTACPTLIQSRLKYPESVCSFQPFPRKNQSKSARLPSSNFYNPPSRTSPTNISLQQLATHIECYATFSPALLFIESINV